MWNVCVLLQAQHERAAKAADVISSPVKNFIFLNKQQAAEFYKSVWRRLQAVNHFAKGK